MPRSGWYEGNRIQSNQIGTEVVGVPPCWCNISLANARRAWLIFFRASKSSIASHTVSFRARNREPYLLCSMWTISTEIKVLSFRFVPAACATIYWCTCCWITLWYKLFPGQVFATVLFCPIIMSCGFGKRAMAEPGSRYGLSDWRHFSSSSWRVRMSFSIISWLDLQAFSSSIIKPPEISMPNVLNEYSVSSVDPTWNRVRIRKSFCKRFRKFRTVASNLGSL